MRREFDDCPMHLVPRSCRRRRFRRHLMRTPSCSRIRVFLVATALVLSVSLFSQSQIQVGFTIMNADPGSVVPVGSALFT